MRDQVGKNGEKQGSESGEAAPKKTHCEGENGKKEERKKQRLSSRNRNRSGRKKAEGKGKARKREHKGST